MRERGIKYCLKKWVSYFFLVFFPFGRIFLTPQKKGKLLGIEFTKEAHQKISNGKHLDLLDIVHMADRVKHMGTISCAQVEKKNNSPLSPSILPFPSFRDRTISTKLSLNLTSNSKLIFSPRFASLPSLSLLLLPLLKKKKTSGNRSIHPRSPLHAPQPRHSPQTLCSLLPPPPPPRPPKRKHRRRWSFFSVLGYRSGEAVGVFRESFVYLWISPRAIVFASDAFGEVEEI